MSQNVWSENPPSVCWTNSSAFMLKWADRKMKMITFMHSFHEKSFINIEKLLVEKKNHLLTAWIHFITGLWDTWLHVLGEYLNCPSVLYSGLNPVGTRRPSPWLTQEVYKTWLSASCCVQSKAQNLKKGYEGRLTFIFQQHMVVIFISVIYHGYVPWCCFSSEEWKWKLCAADV